MYEIKGWRRWKKIRSEVILTAKTAEELMNIINNYNFYEFTVKTL